MTHIVWWGWPTRAEYDKLSLEDNGDAGRVMYQDFFPEGEYTYHRDLRTVPPHVGAVVAINALISAESCEKMGIQSPVDVDFVNRVIEQLPWVIIFVVEDVDSHYKLDELQHPNMKIWTQFAKPKLTTDYPGAHPFVSKIHHLVRRLPESYERWCTITARPPSKPRVVDWMFAGQSIPERHGEWLEALKRLTNYPQPLQHTDALFIKYEGREPECLDICRNKPLFECTRHTCGRIPIEDYIPIVQQSKIVVCRPENCHPETSRISSVLEMGCVPIVSECPALGAFKDHYNWDGYWEYMLGEKPPFPVLKDAKDLGKILELTLADWPANAIRVAEWWADYKSRLCAKLRQEIRGMP